jgi:hypothetical protein
LKLSRAQGEVVSLMREGAELVHESGFNPKVHLRRKRPDGSWEFAGVQVRTFFVLCRLKLIQSLGPPTFPFERFRLTETKEAKKPAPMALEEIVDLQQDTERMKVRIHELLCSIESVEAELESIRLRLIFAQTRQTQGKQEPAEQR